MSTPYQLLYVDGTKSPKVALVQSGSSNPIQVNDIVTGDQWQIGFKFIDATGGIDTRISGSTFQLKAAVGSYTSGIYASSSLWTYSASIWTGSLNLNNAVLTSAMVGKASIPAVFELQVGDTATQTTRSYVSAPITVLNQILI
jgi:hypothetical protein